MGSVGLDAEGRVLVPGLHLLSGNPLQISRQNFPGCDFKHSPLPAGGLVNAQIFQDEQAVSVASPRVP